MQVTRNDYVCLIFSLREKASLKWEYVGAYGGRRTTCTAAVMQTIRQPSYNVYGGRRTSNKTLQCLQRNNIIPITKRCKNFIDSNENTTVGQS